MRHGHRAARLALVSTITRVLAEHLGVRVVPLLALEHAHGDIVMLVTQLHPGRVGRPQVAEPLRIIRQPAGLAEEPARRSCDRARR